MLRLLLSLFLCSFPLRLLAGIGELLPMPKQVIPNGECYTVVSAEEPPNIIVEKVTDLPQVPINKEEGYT